MSERRLAVLWLDEHLLRDVLRDLSTPGCWGCIDFGNVPQGAVLEAVCHDWHRRCFGFRFAHPSFPATPAGELPADLGALRVEVRWDERATQPVSAGHVDMPEWTGGEDDASGCGLEDWSGVEDAEKAIEPLCVPFLDAGGAKGEEVEVEIALEETEGIARQRLKDLAPTNSYARALLRNLAAFEATRAAALVAPEPEPSAVIVDPAAAERLRQRGWEV